MSAEPAPILRVPPNSMDAEKALIASVLTDPECSASVVEIVRPEDFYRSAHARLWGVFVEMFGRGVATDPVVVYRECERAGILDDVGPALKEASAATPMLGMAAHYAEIVREKAVARSLIAASAEVQRAAYAEEGRGDELLDRATGMLREIALRTRSGRAKPVKDMLAEAIAQIDVEQDERSVYTGFQAVDDVVGAMTPGSLNVLGARPSMGKTALALNIAANVAASGACALMFSAEMTRPEITLRLLSAASTVALSHMRAGRFLDANEWAMIRRASAVLSPLRIVVDDRSSPSVEDIRAGILKQQQREPVRLVVVDYLDLVRAPEGKTIRNRENEVAAISRGLKAVAKDCEVPMLVLAQLSREAAKGARDEKDPGPPTLTDLRHSGEIEQNADVVMFLHRKGYYTKQPEDDRSAGVFVKKNRNGRLGEAHLGWCGPIQQFSTITQGA